MDFGKILRKSWDLVWKLKFLWVFGFILALTTTTTNGWWILSGRDRNIPSGVTFQFDGDQILRIMGEGVIVDLTEPGVPRILMSDGSILSIQELLEELDLPTLSDVWTIMGFAFTELLLLLLLRAFLRYSSESAVIRSVNEHQEGEAGIGFGRAFRLGWSRTAWRLFGIDLLIYLVVALGAFVAFVGALVPLLLAINTESEAAIIMAAGLTVILLAGWVLLLGAALLGSSLVRQVSWRACGVEGLGVWASIRRGFAHLRKDIVNLFLTWAISFGVGLGWILALVPLAIVLSPLLIATVMVGVLVGFLPALLTFGIANLFLSWFTSLVLAVMVGFPIFVVVTFSPLFFIGGLVRIYRSNLWTLAYRDLPTIPELVATPSPSPGEPGESGMKALPVG